MKKSLIPSITFTIVTLFTAVSTAQAAVLSVISQPLHNNTAISPAVQSFTAPVTGVVTIIRAAPWTTPPGSGGQLRIYAGEGNTGPLLHSEYYTYDHTIPSGDFQTYILTEPVPVTAGQVYTFCPNNCASGPGFYVMYPDPYPGGSEGPGSSYDLKFEIVIEDGPAPSAGTPGHKAPDDRINWQHGDDYAVIYARQDDKGDPVLHIYCMDEGGNGTLGYILTQEMFDKTPAKPTKNTKVREINVCRVPVKSYVLTTGEYQINIGPNADGKVDVVVFKGLPPEGIHYHRLKWW